MPGSGMVSWAGDGDHRGALLRRRAEARPRPAPFFCGPPRCAAPAGRRRVEGRHARCARGAPPRKVELDLELEISRAPKDPELLAHRLRNNTAASPRDAGGDLDAVWEDVNDSGSETVAGDNPTPDQSLVEENASAMGVSYEDNEELEFIDKIEKRDRDRFELDENSKASENMI